MDVVVHAVSVQQRFEVSNLFNTVLLAHTAVRMNDPNKLTVPPKPPWSEHPIHPKHFLMHMMTGTLVFSMGILASMHIEDYRHTRPHRVYWQNNEMQNDHSIANVKFPPPGNVPVEFGVRDDGVLVWRLKK